MSHTYSPALMYDESLIFIDDLHHRNINGDEDAIEGHLLAPHTKPASICHHQRATTGVTRSEAKPRLGSLTIMRLVHGMITGQMQEWLLRT